VTTYTFRVVVEPDEDRWRAYDPALEAQGASTWGYTREEALANIREVLEMIVGELAEEGRPVPADVASPRSPWSRSRYDGHPVGSAPLPHGPRNHQPPSSATASRSTTSADRTSATVTRTVAG
jgi:predicted RNase H-like HicB family nuclease